MTEDTMVQGNTNGVVDDSTLASEVETDSTLTTQPSDADQLSQIELIRQKYESDISKLKSTFQRKEAEREKDINSKLQQYEAEVERLRVSTMDEDERAAYEQTAVYRRINELEQYLSQVQEEKVEIDSMLKAQQYFLAQGVPASSLVTDSGYDELWNSGMGWLTSDYQRLRNQTTTAPTKPAQRPAITAPDVVTTTNTPAYSGTTWPELIKQYGDEETVYRLVETGQLPATVIPGYRG